jgi:hypothetical protein
MRSRRLQPAGNYFDKGTATAIHGSFKGAVPEALERYFTMKNRFTQSSLDANLEAANTFWKVIQDNK